MTLVGRRKLDHPSLGTAGGSALHASVETLYTNIGDDLGGRFKTASSVANSAVTTFEHNYGTQFSDLKVLLYTGTHPNLTRVADPVASGWTIAATVGFEKTRIDVTAPGSGGPHTFAVFIAQTRGAEKLKDLDDIDFSVAPTDGQFFIYDNAASKWKPAHLKYMEETATISSNTVTPTTGRNIQRITGSAADLHMVGSPIAGKLYVVINETGSSITVKNDTGATAANRIYTGTGVDFTLKNNAAITLVYDSGLSRWVLAGGSGGGGLSLSVQSSAFTAAAGNHYLVDTSSTAFTGTLPSGVTGAVIRFSDENRTWASRNFTIAPASGQSIDGLSADEVLVCDLAGAFVQLMWDGSKWVVDTNGYAASVSTGSLSSSSGTGSLNIVDNPSADTSTIGWTAATDYTVSRDTSNSPLAGVIDSCFAISTTTASTESATSGVYAASLAMPVALRNTKAQVSLYITTPASTDGVWRLSVYNASSTRMSLSSDSSSVTTLPAGFNGQYVCTFDADSSATYTVSLTQTTRTNANTLYYTNISIGNGITAQGAAVGYLGRDTTLTVSAGFGSITSVSVDYWRINNILKARGRFTTGTLAASAATITLRDSHTADLGTSTQIVGRFWNNTASATTRKAFPMIIGNGGSTISISNDDYTAAADPGTGLNASVVANSSNVVWFEYEVPVSAWAGNGTVNLGAGAQVEYAYNSAAWGDSSDTSSFAYGPSGVAFSAVDLTTIRSRRVQFQYPIQSDDKITIEVQINGNWVDAIGAFTPAGYMFQPLNYGASGAAANTYGIGWRPVTGSTTQVDVTFGRFFSTYAGDTLNYSYSTVFASDTIRWRVRKAKASSPVGFGLANSTSSGLIPRFVNATAVTHAAGNFTASAGSWTVDAADQKELTYWVVGDVMTVTFSIEDSSFSGTPAEAYIAIPGGFSVATGVRTVVCIDAMVAGSTTDVGRARVVTGANQIVLFRRDAGNWSGSNNTNMRGQISFRIA